MPQRLFMATLIALAGCQIVQAQDACDANADRHTLILSPVDANELRRLQPGQTLVGSMVCIANYPAVTTSGPAEVRTRSEGGFYAYLAIPHRQQIKNLYFPAWRNVIARFKGAQSLLLSVENQPQCALTGSVIIRPAQVLLIELVGVDATLKGKMSLQSSDAEYVAEERVDNPCASTPSDDVLADEPVPYRVALDKANAAEGSVVVTLNARLPVAYRLQIKDMVANPSLPITSGEAVMYTEDSSPVARQLHQRLSIKLQGVQIKTTPKF